MLLPVGEAMQGIARIGVLATSLAACSFSRTDGVAPPGGDDDGPDAPLATPDAPVTTPDSTQPVTCTAAPDGALSLCLELEDSSVESAVDGSGGHHDATLANVTAATRDVPGTSRALAFDATSSMTIPDSPAWNVQAVSLGAWVKRSGVPSTNGRYGIVDIGRRNAGMALDNNGNVVCFVKSSTTLWVRPGGATNDGEWAFAACTYDAPHLCAYVFRNGSATPDKTCGDTDGDPLDTSDGQGAVGALFDLQSGSLISHFVGAIDAVRVYNRPLTQQELCRSGGITGC